MSIDSFDLVNLSLNSLGFFMIPEETKCPELEKYEYIVDPKLQVNYVQAERVYNLIGSAIKTKEEVTPLQYKKIKAFSLMTLGILSSAVVLTQGPLINGVSWLAAIGVAGVALAIIGAGALTYYYTFYDLDSASVRKDVQEKIQAWDLNKIKTTFSLEDVVKYDLLKEKLAFFTGTQKAFAYSHIKNLYETSQNLEEIKQRDLKKIGEIYSMGMQRVENWINGCRFRYNSINWSHLNNGGRDRDNNPPNQMVQAANAVISLTFENKYRDMKQPWANWYAIESSSIKKAYEVATTTLNQFYHEVLDGKGIPYAESDCFRAG